MMPQNEMASMSTLPTLILGQIERDSFSNERSAIPRLLQTLDIAGCILLAEGAASPRTLGREIIARGAEYVFRVERFHGAIHDDVRDFFEKSRGAAFWNVPMDHLERMESWGGRRGIIRYWYSREVAWLTAGDDWPSLSGIGLVETDVEGEAVQRRHYISSVADRPGDFFRAVMGHCPGEHPTHWSLSLTFPEHRSIESAARNFMILRQVFR
jgi:predicted transposase YbfD/YdcC